MSAAAEARQYRASELAADRIIHIMGILAGLVGAAIMMGIAADIVDRSTLSATLVYSVCLLTMLACSAAYNLASSASRREFLRQLDHAAIFLMIAGTYPIHDVSTTRRMGDRHDRRSLDGSAHRGGHQADLSKSNRASFYCCLPRVSLDNPSGGATDTRFGRCLDGGLDRSWRRPLFHWGWVSPLADAALPEGNMAQPRASSGELPLRSCSAWCGIGPIMTARLATISKRDAADRHEGLAERD
jgi:hypothetical protein